MNPAEVGHDLAGLESVLLINGQRPVELLAGRTDGRRADPELGRVEVDLPAAVRRSVGERERRARSSQAWEGAGSDRVVDPRALRVEELEVRAELHLRHPGRRLARQVAGEVLEVGDRDLAGLRSRRRLPRALRAAV